MARQSRAAYLTAARDLEALATIASGENPDGTAFEIPTAGGTPPATPWGVTVAAMGVAGTGELQGVTSATQLPTLTCKYVRLKARLTNTGNVYLGLVGVTAPDGTTDTTTGFSLTPGDDTYWIPITNMNLLYRICTGTGDALTYMALV